VYQVRCTISPFHGTPPVLQWAGLRTTETPQTEGDGAAFHGWLAVRHAAAPAVRFLLPLA
jgi:hypothetical protein